MKRGFSKRGLSPVVASVLLVFLVLILAAMVFLWASGFFSEQLEKEGQSIEQQCQRVQMRASIGEGFRGERLVQMQLTNDGDVSLYGISIKESRGGNEVSNFFLVNLAPGEGTSVEVSLDSAASEELYVYPVLLGSVVGGSDNKEYTCLDSPTIITL